MSAFRCFPGLVLTACLASQSTICDAAPGKDRAFTGPVIHISTVRFSSMQNDINAAAAAGYRVQMAWAPTHVLMTKATESQPVAYDLVFGFTPTELEAVLKAAGAHGYRVVPRTFVATEQETKNGEPRLQVIVARTAGDSATFSYRVETAVSDYRTTEATGMGPLLSASNEPFGAGGQAAREPVASAVAALGDNGFDIVALLSRNVVVEARKGGIFKTRTPQIQITVIGEQSAAVATDATPDRYRVLFGPADHAMVGELAQASRDGYHGILSSSSASPHVTIVLEKTREESTGTVLAGGLATNPLLLQVTRAARAGYRAVPGFVLDEPVAVLMRRDPTVVNAWQYRVFEEEDGSVLGAAMTDGWVPVSFSADGQTVLAEKAGSTPIDPEAARAVETAARSVADDRIVTFARLATLEKEVEQAAADGFMVRPSFLNDPSFAVHMMRVPDGAPRRSALVLSDGNDDKLEAALNEAAGRGFRVVPGTQMSVVSKTAEDVVIMEKVDGATPPPVSYRVIGAARRSTFDAELAAARVEGDTIVAMLGSVSPKVTGGRLVILERPVR